MEHAHMHDTPIIVLTGGPSSGKTTALAHINDWCTKTGFHPLMVPEAATELITSGFERTHPRFQEAVLEEILHKEHMRIEEARTFPQRKSVIICDRGAIEGRVYNESAFDRACRERNLSLVDLRDKRYSGVIFLQSAANGAEEFYTTSNNLARNETLEEARRLDELTRDVWVGAPHVRVIENVRGKSFDDKMQAVIQALARILGVPEPIECERKFELHAFDRSLLPSHAVDIDIVQTYLVSKEPTVERVRARGQNDSWVFFHTLKEFVSHGVNIEHERIISEHEYQRLLVRRDVSKNVIYKTRTCFFYMSQYFEVDQFHAQREGDVLLELETTSITDEVVIPEFVGPYTERTGDTRFSNAHKAQAM